MLFHTATGLVVFVQAAMSMVEPLMSPVPRRGRFAEPLTTLGGGMAVLLYVALCRGNDSGEVERGAAFGEGAHLGIGVAMTLAGAAAALGRLRSPRLLATELSQPLASLVAAALLLVHSSGAGIELTLHLAIATGLVLSALARLAVVLTGDEARALQVFAALLLATAGILLVLYDAHAGFRAADGEPARVVRGYR